MVSVASRRQPQAAEPDRRAGQGARDPRGRPRHHHDHRRPGAPGERVGRSRRRPASTVVVIGLSTDEVRRTLQPARRRSSWSSGRSQSSWPCSPPPTACGSACAGCAGSPTTARDVAAELSPTAPAWTAGSGQSDDGTEVGQLADSMNTLLGGRRDAVRRAARRARQRMRQFLADASHELRTPLTSIRGYAELARMQRAPAAARSDATTTWPDRIRGHPDVPPGRGPAALARGDQARTPRAP